MGKTTERTPKFSREVRHEFRYLLSVFLADILSWLFWLIPQRPRYWLADRVADAFHRSTHTYRDNVQANVSQVLHLPVDDQAVTSATRSIFRTSSRNFTDLVTMPRMRKQALLDSLADINQDWSTLDRAFAKGKGTILVSCHLGSFDYVGQVLRARGYRLTIVTGRTTSRFIFDGVTHLRGSKGAALVEPTPSGVRTVIRALRRNECAVIVSDRDFFQNGRPVEFFGRPTTLPPGAIRIARDTGATIVPIMARRIGLRHEVRFMAPITVDKTNDLEADMDAGFGQLIPAMEHGIRDRIDQWVMFQRAWPVKPPPALRVFPEGSPLESELLERVARVLPERRGQ